MPFMHEQEFSQQVDRRAAMSSLACTRMRIICSYKNSMAKYIQEAASHNRSM
jgi:hypothetical protein